MGGARQGTAVWRLRLDHAASSPALARACLDAPLRRMGLPPDLQDDVRLVASELIANGVLHGAPALELVLVADGWRVRVEVTDGSAELPRLRDYGLGAQSGRGLAVVAATSRAWGAEPTGGGKVVWAELETRPGAPRPTVPAPAPAAPAPAGSWLAGRATVRYPGVPVAVYQRMQEHQDAVLREAELVALSSAFPDDDDLPPPPEVSALLADLQQQLAQPPEALRSAVAAAARRGDATVDLELALDPAAAARVAGLADLLARADQAARDGHLLLDPADDEVVALRSWFAARTSAQLAGPAEGTGAPTAS